MVYINIFTYGYSSVFTSVQTWIKILKKNGMGGLGEGAAPPPKAE